MDCKVDTPPGRDCVLTLALVAVLRFFENTGACPDGSTNSEIPSPLSAMAVYLRGDMSLIDLS